MIYPAILSDVFEVVQQQLLQFKDSTRPIHIDIIDGEYTDNLTIALDQLSELDLHSCTIDLHLMVVEPADVILDIDPSLPIGTVFAQIERMRNPSEFAEQITERGWKQGYALDLYTPIEELEECLVTKPSGVLIMNVKAGFQEQSFSDLSIEKLQAVRRDYSTSSPQLEILSDGGLNSAKLISNVFEQGATSVAVGSYLWKQSSPAEALAELEHQLKNQLKNAQTDQPKS